jgi:toxin-antitoxin system PIN domain toxin
VFVVDTNILVYAANADCAEHARARQLLETWRAGPLPWFLTWNIVYEFLRVVTHARVLPRPWDAAGAWRFVDALLASSSVGLLVHEPGHAKVAESTLRDTQGLAGNLVHDFHTAVLMREHGIRRIYTRDQDFRRFRFLEAVDPLTTLPD